MATGLIMYTDGGARSGYAGWGMHGYLYTDVAAKKNNVCPGHLITDIGYIDKTLLNDKVKEKTSTKQNPTEVTPINYINAYGSFSHGTTNNVAELTAAISSMRYAQQHDLNSVKIYTDSEYVQKGFDGWADSWAKNGWIRRDGGPVSNTEQWQALLAGRDALQQKGVQIEINWVKAHSGLLGNEEADKLATVGIMQSKLENTNAASVTIKTIPVEGFWKYDIDKHPFINSRRMYFNTVRDHVVPGEYFLGDHGKDDDLLGKRITDGAYSVVYLETPDTVLEMIRDRQIKMANHTDNIIMVRLDHLYRPSTHQELSTYGALAMEQINEQRLDLFCLDREPLTRELKPPRLAMRAVEAINALVDKLDEYLAGDENIVVTDLTDILYEKKTVVKKKITTESFHLRSEFEVGFSALTVEAKYGSKNVPSATLPIILTMGVDMLDRNALRKLEADAPKIVLITWMESLNSFRYATIATVGNDRGIWCGYYSNLRLIA